MSRRLSEGVAVPVSMIVMAFLLPLGTTTLVSGTGEFNQRLVAPVWMLSLSGPIAGAFDFDTMWLYLTALDFLPQLLLATVTSLYYQGIVSRKVVILSGFVSPLVYMRGYLAPVGELQLWMHYPIPVMLVIVLVMMIIHPARQDVNESKTIPIMPP